MNSRTYLGSYRFHGSGNLQDLKQARDTAAQASKTLAEAIAQLARLAQHPEIEAVRHRLASIVAVPGEVAAQLDVLAAQDEQVEMARVVEIEDSGVHRTCTNRLYELDQAIRRDTIQLARRRDNVSGRHYELMQKGLSREEADKVCPPVTDAEVAAAQLEIAAMQEERESIGAFLGDKPRYRLELLRGPIADTARALLEGLRKAA